MDELERPVSIEIVQDLAQRGLVEDVFSTINLVPDLKLMPGATLLALAIRRRGEELQKQAQFYANLSTESDDPEWKRYMKEKASVLSSEGTKCLIDTAKRIEAINFSPSQG